MNDDDLGRVYAMRESLEPDGVVPDRRDGDADDGPGRLSQPGKLAGMEGQQFELGVADTGRAHTTDLHRSIDNAPDGIPDGYRAWRTSDGAVVPPTLGRDAYHGPIGEYLDLLDGQTEAHPAAIGAHLLGAFATMIGRSAVYVAGRVTHRCNLFVAVVGLTSRGAKGVAQSEANRLIRAISPDFLVRHTLGGLGSGEALVFEVRDPDPDPDREDMGGVKERIVQNAELSSTLKVCSRDGSILGDHLRLAFDGEPMRHSTRGTGIVTATEHHISIVGSITPTELLKVLDDVSRANGFGNRFQYVHSHIGPLLPFGGQVDDNEIDRIAALISSRLTDFETYSAKVDGQVVFSIAEDALDRWDRLYRWCRLGLGQGLVAEMTARSVAHAARIALIYAVLDGAHQIGTAHLDAAEAWVSYGAETVELVFGSGVPGIEGTLLQAIREAGPDGLTLTQQTAVFHRNLPAKELSDARQVLTDRNLITTFAVPGAVGRPTQQSVAIWPTPEVRANEETNSGSAPPPVNTSLLRQVGDPSSTVADDSRMIDDGPSSRPSTPSTVRHGVLGDNPDGPTVTAPPPPDANGDLHGDDGDGDRHLLSSGPPEPDIDDDY